MQQVGQYVKLRGDAAIEQEVARVVETELSRGQVGFFVHLCLIKEGYRPNETAT